MDDDGHVMIDEGDDVTQVDSSIFGSITSILDSGVSFIETYGWFILVGCIIIYYFYSRFRQRSSSSFRREPMKSNKNEDEELERMRRIEEVRRKQQEALDMAAKKYLEDKKKKDEADAKRKAEEWEKQKQGQSTKNTTKTDDLAKLGLTSSNLTKKPRLRTDDYNPLLGSSNSGASCSFRPGKRGGPRGG